MKKLLVVIIVAGLAVGCKKPKETTGAGSGSGSATTTATTSATGSGAGSGGAVWTEAVDPLQQAVLAATADTAKLLVAKDRSLATQVIDATAAAHKAVSREAWDPAAVIATVGKDRGALFTWVRDRTALVPYRGSLRGPIGVMMDRVGNSLDRALLLADLLTQGGLEVRLANAQLEPAVSERLVASWKTRARPALPTAHIDDDALNATLAKLIGADPAALQAKIAKEKVAADALAARTKARIASHTKALAAMVPAPAGPANDGTDAFADHWWVQVRDGEAWSNLDPSLPTAVPGESLAATPTETLAPADLGDDRRHVLAIRVIGEVWHDDTREETTLVEHAFAPSQFYGQKIAVSNLALDMPDDKTLITAPDRIAAVRTALLAQTEFAPMIRIGTRPVIRFSVNDRGELLDLTAGDGNTIRLGRAVQHATKDGVGAANDLLDELPAGDPAAGSAAAPTPKVVLPGFTAEWLEVELRTPGAPPRVVRRTVFDVIGPVADRAAARRALAEPARLERALALTGETELLALFAQLPEAFVADRIASALVAARDVIAALAARKDVVAQSGKLAELASIPGPIYNLALARFAVDPQIYLDRLNVLALRRRSIAKPRGFGLRQEVDIFANAVAAWPTAKDPRVARIAQGVADTELEGVTIACSLGLACTRAPSTSELYAADAKGWSVIATPQGAAAADHDAGYVVVAQAASPRTWWRVDPTTGETLGMNPMGGSVSGEQTALYYTMRQNYILAIGGLAKCLYDNVNTPNTNETFQMSMVCIVAVSAGLLMGNAAGSTALTTAILLLSNWFS